jgi:hypothetical protein
MLRPDAAPTQFRSERDGRDALVDPGVDTEHAQNPEQRFDFRHPREP